VSGFVLIFNSVAFTGKIIPSVVDALAGYSAELIKTSTRDHRF